MKPVAVNAVFVRPGRVGGAEMFCYDLIHGLDAVMPAVQGPLRVTHAEQWPLAERLASVEYSAVRARVNNRFLTESLPGAFPDLALISPNYFTPPGRGPRLTVIMDAQYHHMPHNFSGRKRVWLRGNHARTLRRADAVVTFSSFVRSDLLSIHGDQFASKVHVIPCPIRWDRLSPEASARVDPFSNRHFILSAAHAWPHKNVKTLLAAFARLRERGSQLELVLVGQPQDQLIGMRFDRDAAAGGGQDDGVHRLGYVSDGELGALYRSCAALVHPSLFEGFGIPLAEALGLGKPVITNRLTAIPEVTQGLATYVDDAEDPRELAATIETVTDNPAGFAPSDAQVRTLRQTYAAEAVAQQYLALLGA